MSDDRLLVIDESLNPRLSTELQRRGHNAQRLSALGLKGLADPELLQRLAKELADWVLITADDNMPWNHPAIINALDATIATIDPRRRKDYNIDQWRREIVHRWVHVIADQPRGSVRRYSLKSHRVWRPRRRP